MAQNDDRKKRERALLCGLSMVIFMSGFVLLYLYRDNTAWPYLLLLACLVLSCVPYIYYRKISFKIYKQTAPTTAITLLDNHARDWKQDISDIQFRFGNFDSTSAFFVQMFIAPQGVIDRISETVEPYTRSLNIRSAYTVTVPSNTHDADLVLPLFMSKRGHLEDGLKISDQNSNRISSMSSTATVSFVCACIRKLVESATPSHSGTYIDIIEPRIIRILSSHLPVPESQVDDVIDQVFGLSIEPTQRHLLSMVALIIRKLRVQHPICVIERFIDCAEPQGVSRASDRRDSGDGSGCVAHTLRLTVERRVILQSIYKTEESISLYDRFRQHLGIRPSSIVVPLRSANQAKSYHLQVKGPEGTYLARQEIVGVRDDAEPHRLNTSSASAVQWGSRHGQRHAHLYIKNGEGLERHFFDCNFFERSPGSVAPATFASIAAFVTILICGVTISFRQDNENIDSNLIAVLLAAPAVMGAWAGFDSGKSLSGGTMVARVSSMCTIAMALIAAVLYTLYNKISGVFGFLDESFAQGIWTILIGLAALNMVATALSWILRSGVETFFLSRQPGSY